MKTSSTAITAALLRNSRKTDSLPAAKSVVVPLRLAPLEAAFALLRNSRKTDSLPAAKSVVVPLRLAPPEAAFALLTIFLVAFSAFARDHRALNGTWTLVPGKSDFAGQPALQSGTVTINDREGNITISRNLVYAGAPGETIFYSDMTDGQNRATIQNGKDVTSKTKWDHDVLKVTTTQSGAVTLESYALAPDGTMTVTVVRPEHKAIMLVFERK
jgi:hypothetical protein